MFEKVFEPIQIRGMKLKNRVVMSAMGTHESVESKDGKSVTDKLIAYHVARAKGGNGLNTVEVTAIDEASAPYGFLSIANDSYIPGFKKLNDAVHDVGGKTCIQLWQGGLAVASDPKAEILLPNDMPLSAEYTVKGITSERLWDIIDKYGTATKRCVEAGFDCVEFHCAHNYLPHSMLSGGINHRKDEWGGSFENRKKFPLECIKAIRKNMPEDMPLFMRIDCHDDMLEGGLTIEDVIDFCKDAKELGVDVLNVSRGNILTAATLYEVAPVDIENGFNVEDAARIRKETGMLTMPCGRINTPELAEKILEEDKADLIVMARAQLADANFCNKAKEGKIHNIRYCIGCNQGCYDTFCASLYDPSIKHITCMRNPGLLEEATESLTFSNHPKKVLILGGGIAGMEAAIDLKETGNEAILYEKSSSLGGQFELAGAISAKRDFKNAVDKMIQNVYELGIEVHLNEECTKEKINEIQPDALIVAIGSTPFVLPIEGKEKCLIAQDVLSRSVKVDGEKVVIIGGGLVGFETAEFLAEQGKKVTILEMKNKALQDLGSLRQITAQFALAKLPIEIITSAKVEKIEGCVIASVNGEEKEYPYDALIMAIGSKSNDTSVYTDLGIPTYVIGDAKKAGVALDAFRDAYQAVLDINKE